MLPLGSEHGEDDEHTVTSGTSQDTALTQLRKSMERCVISIAAFRLPRACSVKHSCIYIDMCLFYLAYVCMLWCYLNCSHADDCGIAVYLLNRNLYWRVPRVGCCRKQLQLDGGLEQLRRFFAWIFLITGTLNLIVMIVMRSMLSNYGGLLSDMQLFGQRQVLIQVCVDCSCQAYTYIHTHTHTHTHPQKYMHTYRY